MKTAFIPLYTILVLLPFQIQAQGESFTRIVLNEKAGSGNYRLAHPFDILYGPDDHLYITEKVGRVLRVDTGTGVAQVILDIRSLVALNITRNSAGAATGIGQNGMLGLALHPGFGKGTGQDSVFVAYSYSGSAIRIVRYKYNSGATPTLTNGTTIIQGIPAGGDHSTGRMIVGADDKLYYSCGDLGNNQFDNRCTEIKSQKLPAQAEVNAADYALYSGKILRMNLDGSIPADNPLWNSVQSHIYTIGHRNPQGLVWEKEPTDGFTYPTLTSGGRLYSSEHGPNSDDEINSIEPGRNYGWPYIAGDSDEVNFQYVNWSTATNCNVSYVENPFYVPAGATVMQEKQAPADVKVKFRKPLARLYTICGSKPASDCALDQGWLKFPTIAPSSIEFYQLSTGKAIPNWYPSLLVPTLRTGTLFRYRLNAARDAIIGDSIPYFKSVNRYRDIALSPDGKIYLITDSIGSTSGPSGANAANLEKKGAILVFKYTGSVLAYHGHTVNGRPEYVTSVYPNPATTYIQVETDPILQKPLRYQLLDATGRIVIDQHTAQVNFTIPVGQFKRGVYILVLTNGYGAEVRKEKMVLR